MGAPSASGRRLAAANEAAHRRTRTFAVIADARAKLYCSIAEVAQVTWVVDSGKDPWFGSLLSRLFADNFRTVHIVRDPHGVAFSWSKTVKSDSEPGYLPHRHPAITAFTWLIQNLVIQLAVQRLSASYVRVRYEDLAADPEAIVRDIACSVNIGADRPLNGKPQEGPGRGFHWVAGNPGVRQSVGSCLEIRLDEEWRDRLPVVQRWLVTAICGALSSAYGYPFLHRKGRRLAARTGPLLSRPIFDSSQPIHAEAMG